MTYDSAAALDGGAVVCGNIFTCRNREQHKWSGVVPAELAAVLWVFSIESRTRIPVLLAASLGNASTALL